MNAKRTRQRKRSPTNDGGLATTSQQTTRSENTKHVDIALVRERPVFDSTQLNPTLCNNNHDRIFIYAQY